MYSALLHFFMVPFIILLAAKLYSAWREKDFLPSMEKYLFIILFFFAVHHSLLSLPFLFFGNLHFIIAGYIAGIVVLFAALATVFKVEVIMINVKKSRKNVLQLILFLVISLITYLNILYLPQPRIESGFIIWNANIFAEILEALTAFIIGMHLVFLMIPRWPKGINSRERLKAILFVSGAGLLSSAGLIYFLSHYLILTIISFAFCYLGTFFILFSLSLKKVNI